MPAHIFCSRLKDLLFELFFFYCFGSCILKDKIDGGGPF